MHYPKYTQQIRCIYKLAVILLYLVFWLFFVLTKHYASQSIIASHAILKFVIFKWGWGGFIYASPLNVIYEYMDNCRRVLYYIGRCRF